MKIITNTKFYLENSKWISEHDFTSSGEIYKKDGTKVNGYLVGNYFYVTIRGNDGRSRSHSVHRVIANLLLPNDKNLGIVTHKNGIKPDNSISNLEWTTKQEATANNINNGYIKKSTKAIIAIDTNTNRTYEFGSVLECAKFFNISANSIASRIRTNKTSRLGIRFEYKDESNNSITQKLFDSLIKSGELYEHPKYKGYFGWVTCGKIISSKRGVLKVLKPFVATNGYNTLCIRHDNKPTSIQLHRFLYECAYDIILDSSVEIDHIDCNPNNNSIKNLQVLSKEENIKKSSNKALTVVFCDGTKKYFNSVIECANYFGVSTPTIRAWRRSITKPMKNIGIKEVRIGM